MKKNHFFFLLLFGISHLLQAQTNWSQIIKTASSTRDIKSSAGRYPDDGLGASVAIDGNFAVIGIPNDDEDSEGRNTIFDSGSVLLFENINGEWTQIKKIVANERVGRSNFGFSVAISGTTIVIGSPSEGTTGYTFAGSAYIFSKDQGGTNNWGQVKKIVAQDRTSNAHFGRAVGISGTNIIVGAHNDGKDATGGNILTAAGSAYIFNKDQGGTDNWGQVKKIVAEDRKANYKFGFSVAISNSSVVVGSFESTGAYSENITSAGLAYIFNKDQGGTNNWGQVKKIVGSQKANTNDVFGASVAISNNTIVVGNIRIETAFIFNKDQGGVDNWGEIKKINISPPPTFQAFFGVSVSISGTEIAVGASIHHFVDADNKIQQESTGATFIFSKDAGGSDNWGQVKKIVALENPAYNYMGQNVAISGNNVVAGAYIYNSLSESARMGTAYIFGRNQGGMDNWGQSNKIILNDLAVEQYYGHSVATDGDYAVIGSYQDPGNGLSLEPIIGSGAAYILKNINGTWTEVKKIVASDRAKNDNFAYSVAISGTTIVVGAYQEDNAAAGGDSLSDAGSAYIFSKDEGGTDNWGQVRKIVAGDRGENDNFGKTVAISGNTVAIGALNQDQSASGGGVLSNAGAVYIFNKDKNGINNWGQVKKIVSNDRAEDDRFGYSVAISGSTVLVGAIGDDFEDLGPIDLPFFPNFRTASTTINDVGAAYLFGKDVGGTDNWGQLKKIEATLRGEGDKFGSSVAIDNATAVVGAVYDIVLYNYRTSVNHTYIFGKDKGGTNNWGLTKKINAGNFYYGEGFGYSLAINGSSVVVGSPNAPINSVNDIKGATYVFNKDQGGTNNWGLYKKLIATDGAYGDNFGNSVAISGTNILIGASKDDEDAEGLKNLTDAGSAYFFGPPSTLPTIVTNGILSTFNSCSGIVSTAQSFTISGSNLTANITVTAPSGFEVSKTSSSAFGTSVVLTQVSGSVANTTIYVRMAATATGTPSGNISCASTSATTKNVAVSATVNALPTITLGTISSVTSTATSFSIPYTATAGSPNQYSVVTSTPTAMPSFTAVSNTTLPTSPISVTIPASVGGNYNFNLTVRNSTTGCVSATVSMALEVISTSPIITTTGTLAAFSTCAGTVSAEKSFTVSGNNLTADVTITAPTGFEVSKTSGSGFGASTSVAQVSGSVANTTIYVRMAANAAGTPNGNISCTSTDATTKNVAASGTVNTSPAPAASAQAFCGTATVAGLVVTQNVVTQNTVKSIENDNSQTINSVPVPPVFNWYNVATGGTPLVSSTTLVSGTYYVSQTINGCESVRISVSVTVKPKPALPTISGSNEICEGFGTTLSIPYYYWFTNPQVPISYRWTGNLSGNSIEVSPLTTRNYRVAVTIDGCTSDSSAVFTLTINPKPAIPTITSDNMSICKGGTAILTGTCSTANASFRWTTPPFNNGNQTSALPATNDRIITEPGVYKGLCESDKGCLSAEVSITITQAADCSGQNFITITPEKPAICPGTAITMTATGCTGTLTWNWLGATNSPTGTSASLSPATTTDYLVNCSTGGSATFKIVVAANTVAIGQNIGTGKERFKAVTTLTSDKKIGNANFTPGANVIYEAGNSITLLPGFTAEKWSIFKAEIKTCPPTGN